MEIIKKSVEQLAFDPANARTHDQKNLDAIKGSLAKFGQQKPIVIDRGGVVIAGNGTLEAARQLGWDEIEVVVTTLDSWQKTAYALADNRTAELAAWDRVVLAEQLESLTDVDFDVSEIGFEVDKEEDDFEYKDPGDPNGSKLEDNKLTIICESLEQKDTLFAELNDRGFKVK